jgi:hypothetical protein
MTAEIVDFLTARWDEEELWAAEASRNRHNERVATGVHWQWVNPDSDAPVTIDPTAAEHIAQGGTASLRSVEEFPVRSIGDLPVFAINEAVEIGSAAAAHIVRHDPAHVLADIAAKRRILYLATQLPKLYARTPWADSFDNNRVAWEEVLKQLAAVYEQHPEYKETWRP